MPLSLTVHVGPFAELLIPHGQPVNHELLDSALNGLNHNLEYDQRVVIAGVKHRGACFAPYFGRYSPPERSPPRKMHWSSRDGELEGAVVELIGVSTADEIAWFERTFADELTVLAEAYGVPVRACWGVMPSLW